jgi:hypothetical protein
MKVKFFKKNYMFLATYLMHKFLKKGFLNFGEILAMIFFLKT